jgi:catechol 2,3-dioxygenase-like lactoylglutathione lyase family enzyme
MAGLATLAMVNLDCAEPTAMVDFYRDVLGWEITYRDENYGMVNGNGTAIGFGKVADYQPPRWPDADSPKRYHLDLYVDDLDKAEASCRELGAGKPEFQPGADRWRVLTDPAGHPFCICIKQDG